jgi:hypothetical protein
MHTSGTKMVAETTLPSTATSGSGTTPQTRESVATSLSNPAASSPNGTEPSASLPAQALAALPDTQEAPTTIPPAKKRKTGSRTVPVTQLLSDHPIIQKTVHNLLALLQLYGALTVGQMEYNLPPIVGERVNSQSIHDMVQVLVCMGVIHKVQEPTLPAVGNRIAENGDGGPPPAPKPTRYCINQGIPRADTVLPHQLLDHIASAHVEIKRSAERRNRLEQALESKSSPKELMKELAVQYPEIKQDPVYVTALKSFHMDISALDRERRIRLQQKALRDMSKPTEKKTPAAPSSTAEKSG